MDENAYQKLHELIKDDSKSELFAAGGVFSGRKDEDHSVLKLFGEYVNDRKIQNKGIPENINSADFLSYAGMRLADKPEELKDLTEKIESLKIRGKIEEKTLANNTFYNFAIILSDLDIVANPDKITSLYEVAFERAMTGPQRSETAVEPQRATASEGLPASAPASPVAGLGEGSGEPSTNLTGSGSPAVSSDSGPSSTQVSGTKTDISGAAGEINIGEMGKLSPTPKAGTAVTAEPERSEGSLNPHSAPKIHDQATGELSPVTGPERAEGERRSPRILQSASGETTATSVQASLSGESDGSATGPQRADHSEPKASEGLLVFQRFQTGGSQLRRLTTAASRLQEMPKNSPQNQQ